MVWKALTAITDEEVRDNGTLAGRTAEYAQIARHFGRTRDLYRKHNPGKHGATWDPPANRRMVRGNQTRKRLDYVFAIDSIAHPDPKKPRLVFRKLACKAAEVLPFQTADGGNLSDHFGLQVEVGV